MIDSLIACHSGDENNNVAMRQLMSGLDGLARWGDLGLLLVHHQRKKGNNNDAGIFLTQAVVDRMPDTVHVRDWGYVTTATGAQRVWRIDPDDTRA